jgi:hypothetical protein
VFFDNAQLSVKVGDGSGRVKTVKGFRPVFALLPLEMVGDVDLAVLSSKRLYDAHRLKFRRSLHSLFPENALSSELIELSRRLDSAAAPSSAELHDPGAFFPPACLAGFQHTCVGSRPADNDQLRHVLRDVVAPGLLGELQAAAGAAGLLSGAEGSAPADAPAPQLEGQAGLGGRLLAAASAALSGMTHVGSWPDSAPGRATELFNGPFEAVPGAGLPFVASAAARAAAVASQLAGTTAQPGGAAAGEAAEELDGAGLSGPVPRATSLTDTNASSVLLRFTQYLLEAVGAARAVLDSHGRAAGEQSVLYDYVIMGGVAAPPRRAAPRRAAPRLICPPTQETM